MINPDKIYKASPIFTIITIQPGLELFVVQDEDGQRFDGYLDRLYNRPERWKNVFKVGDKVKCGMKGDRLLMCSAIGY